MQSGTQLEIEYEPMAFEVVLRVVGAKYARARLRRLHRRVRPQCEDRHLPLLFQFPMPRSRTRAN
jgi:hypothetical protein